jgi:ADP-heptose:LPS heptosyltransferase
MKKQKKILVVDFGGIGDLVLSIPFLRGIRTAFPSSKVSILCADNRGMILKEQPCVARIFLSPITLLGLLKTGLQLRKKRFDIAVNLMPETSFFSAIKMNLLFLVINARQWIGRNTEGRGFFYDVKVSEEKMQMENEVLMHGMILKTISKGDFDETLEFHCSKRSRKKAGELLSKERNFQEDPLVLINPGSDWLSRRWPIKRYAELVKRLSALFPFVEFGVIGTSAERMLANFLKEAVGDRVFILSGKTPLEIIPAITKKASLLITNDSGPAHIARAVGTPVVILAGPSAPAFLTIRGRNESVVLQHLVSCSPCLKVACDTMDCLNVLSVDEVVAVASKMLRNVIGANSQGHR